MSSMKSLKLQTVFDIVVTHLYRQGRKAMSNGSCRYRGDEGTSCAVGCLIEDEQYDPAWEGKTVLTVGLAGLFTGEQQDLLIDLQGAHDMFTSPGSKLEGRLRDVADYHGLEYRAEHYPTVPTVWA